MAGTSSPKLARSAVSKIGGLMKKRILLPLLFLCWIIATLNWMSAALPDDMSRIKQSTQYKKGMFYNAISLKVPRHSPTGNLQGSTVRPAPPKYVPIVPLDKELLLALPKDETSVFRLGHSTVLIHISGEFWLLDPMFSERASPFRFVGGPKRFHPTPISIGELPPIKGVVISHNHYDHLDKASIKQLKDKVEHFVVPLGVDGDLQRWGIPVDRITSLDWWQNTKVGELELIATPSQHFSGRSLNDRDKTLWASWVLRSADTSIYFSGDTGYFLGFKQIGERFGPFDLTIMEAGAWDEHWPDLHMTPQETVQAHIDLRGKKLLPVHNSTFNLAYHSWHEPLEKVSALAAEKNLEVLTPQMGQRVSLSKSSEMLAWWR